MACFSDGKHARNNMILSILFNQPSSSNAGRRRQWNSLKPFSEMLNIQVVPIILTLIPKHSEIIEYAKGKNQPWKLFKGI